MEPATPETEAETLQLACRPFSSMSKCNQKKNSSSKRESDHPIWTSSGYTFFFTNLKSSAEALAHKLLPDLGDHRGGYPAK
jgi:hypothetical protein